MLFSKFLPPNPKGLAQVVRTLVLMAFLLGLRFESPWVQTIPWGQPADEARVLPNSCEGDTLHGSEVYPTGMDPRSGPSLEGFLVIKKLKKKKKVLLPRNSLNTTIISSFTTSQHYRKKANEKSSGPGPYLHSDFSTLHKPHFPQIFFPTNPHLHQ